MNKTVPITSGYGSVKANVGSVRNRGFEFTLNTVNIENKTSVGPLLSILLTTRMKS